MHNHNQDDKRHTQIIWLNSIRLCAPSTSELMTASGEDSASEVIGRMGRASGFLDDNDRLQTLPKACEVSKEVLLRGAKRLVADSGGRPMVTSKSADGTPITVVHRNTYQLPQGKQVRKSGHACKEFLVQNQFLRVNMGPDGVGDEGAAARANSSDPWQVCAGFALCKQSELGHFAAARPHRLCGRALLLGPGRHRGA